MGFAIARKEYAAADGRRDNDSVNSHFVHRVKDRMVFEEKQAFAVIFFAPSRVEECYKGTCGGPSPYLPAENQRY